jgi:hypothetical protein
MKNFSLNFQKPVLISKASLTEINIQSQFSEREFFQHIIIIANSYVKQLKQNVSSLGQSSGIIFLLQQNLFLFCQQLLNYSVKLRNHLKPSLEQCKASSFVELKQ